MHLVAQWEKNLWPRSCRCLQAQVQELMSSSTCNDSAQVRCGTRTRTGGDPKSRWRGWVQSRTESGMACRHCTSAGTQRHVGRAYSVVTTCTMYCCIFSWSKQAEGAGVRLLHDNIRRHVQGPCTPPPQVNLVGIERCWVGR